jgi:hypothetical protein
VLPPPISITRLRAIGDTAIDERGFVGAADHFDRMAEQALRRRDERIAIARDTQRVGSHHAHGGWRQRLQQHSQSLDAAETALDRGVLQQTIAQAGRQLDFIAAAQLRMPAVVPHLRYQQVKAVRTEIQYGDGRAGCAGLIGIHRLRGISRRSCSAHCIVVRRALSWSCCRRHLRRASAFTEDH